MNTTPLRAVFLCLTLCATGFSASNGQEAKSRTGLTPAQQRVLELSKAVLLQPKERFAEMIAGEKPEVMALLREVAVRKVKGVNRRAALLVLLRSGDAETVEGVGRQISEFKNGAYGRIADELLKDAVDSGQIALTPFFSDMLFVGGEERGGDIVLNGVLRNQSSIACRCMIDIIAAAQETPDSVRTWIGEVEKSDIWSQRDTMRKWWKINEKHLAAKNYGALSASTE